MSEKEENRKNMPQVTAFIDSFREYFPDLQVTYAKENGIELGVPGQKGCTEFVISTPETHTIALGGVKNERSRGRRG